MTEPFSCPDRSSFPVLSAVSEISEVSRNQDRSIEGARHSDWKSRFRGLSPPVLCVQLIKGQGSVA